MKKPVCLLLGLIVSISALSQSQRAIEIFNEDFSSGVPPTGWIIEGVDEQWSQAFSAHAGGTSPEAQLHWTNGDYSTRLISQEYDLTGLTTIIFSFKHFLNDFLGDGYTIGLSTRSGGGAWTDVWDFNPSGDIGPETKDFILTGGDVGASDFQISLFLIGNSHSFNDWYIDDIFLFQPDVNDVAMDLIIAPDYAEEGDFNISCTIKNIGISTVNSIDLNYQIDDGAVITGTMTGMYFQTNHTSTYTFATPWLATPGDYILNVWVSNFNGSGDDDDTSNDVKSMPVSIAMQTTQNLPLLELFTSSTCGPCAPFNINVINPFMASHLNDIAVIKYQMSWPGSGDPYYTVEGGVRKEYYWVNFVPDLYTGGSQTYTNSNSVNSAYNFENARAAFFNMSPSLEIDNDNVIVNVNITPYISVDMTVQIAVLEKETTGNVMNNGETSFENVMMKMLPDAEGTLVSFERGTDVEITESFDMSSTNVEEMEDLLVVVFIQDDETKQIMQSTFAYGEPLGLDDNYLQNVSFYPNPSNGYITIETDRELQILIHDILGKKVYSKTGINTETLNLTHLNSGVYLVNMTDGSNQITKKLIINK